MFETKKLMFVSADMGFFLSWGRCLPARLLFWMGNGCPGGVVCSAFFNVSQAKCVGQRFFQADMSYNHP